MYHSTLYYLETAFFLLIDTSHTEIYTLSLHDALPIFPRPHDRCIVRPLEQPQVVAANRLAAERGDRGAGERSEEHTSELQSPDQLVCRLLLEKKNNKVIYITITLVHSALYLSRSANHT